MHLYKTEWIQSFRVEGPQNGDNSIFIENTFGRFLLEIFKEGKQPTTTVYCDYNINKTRSVNGNSVAHIDTIKLCKTSAHIEKNTNNPISFLLQHGAAQRSFVTYCFYKSGYFHSKSLDREIFTIIPKIGRSPAKSGDLEVQQNGHEVHSDCVDVDPDGDFAVQ